MNRQVYKIEISLDKKVYDAGNQVNGSVKLNLKDKFPGNKVYLTIKGMELITTNSSKQSRMEFSNDSDGNDNRPRAETNNCI